jgi:hypothetical protein
VNAPDYKSTAAMAQGKTKIVGKLTFVLDENAVIGRGKRSSTVVYEGEYEGIPVAVKRILKREFALNEAEQLSQHDRHDNIARYYITESDDFFQ